jgi:hypothetical protein
MSARYLESMIRRVPLFASLPSQQFDLILRAFEQRRYSAGEMILVQGTVPTGLYILLQGDAVWIQTAVNGAANQIGMMQIGQHIHDEALLRDNVTDTASLQAHTTTTMLILNRKAFTSLLTKYPELQEGLGIRIAVPKAPPKAAPKKKPVKNEAQLLHMASFSPFLNYLETESGAAIYRKHWSFWIAQVFLPVALSLAGFGGMLSILLGRMNPEFEGIAWSVSGLMLFVGLVWYFVADWLWKNEFYYVSNKDVMLVYKPSVFQARVLESFALQNLKDVQIVPQSLWQRMMAYGDLELSFMDGSEEAYLENVAAPSMMQYEIIRRQQALVRHGAQDTERREREVMTKFKTFYEENAPKPSLPYDNPTPSPRPSPYLQPRPKTGEISLEQPLPPNPAMPQKAGTRPPKFPRKREP